MNKNEILYNIKALLDVFFEQKKSYLKNDTSYEIVTYDKDNQQLNSQSINKWENIIDYVSTILCEEKNKQKIKLIKIFYIINNTKYFLNEISII